MAGSPIAGHGAPSFGHGAPPVEAGTPIRDPEHRVFDRNVASGRGVRVFLEPTWQQVLNNAIRAEWATVARDMETTAKAMSPYKTGRLRRSLRGKMIWPPRPGPVATGAVLESDVAYAGFVEYGTGRRGAVSTQPTELPSGYVHGPSPGARAQPFARPAMMSVLRRHFRM